MSSVWVSFELQKAVDEDKGYLIVQVRHFPNKTDTLFRDYVKTFLKCKQEASGYPSRVKTPEPKEKYLDGYLKKEGIKLKAASTKR